MSQNFLRIIEVALSDGSAKIRGGGETDLRIKGAVRQWGLQSPNMSTVRVYNPAPSTIAQFKEGKTITISAGYELGTTGLIFTGTIKQVVSGHETAVDTFVEIYAADGQRGYEAARVGSSLAAGHTPKDRVDLALKAMATFGVSAQLGLTNVDLSQPKAPRGAAFVGAARDILRNAALSAGATWSIQDGSVHIVDQRKPVAGGAIKLTPLTGGLVGWPKQTSEGIEVTSLINPALRPHVNIELDASQIQQAEQNNNPFDKGGAQSNAFLNAQNVQAGIYNIFYMDRFFDTRGQEFYDVSLCIGQGGSVPLSQASQGYYTLGGS